MARPLSGAARPQGAPAHVLALHCRLDRARRSQECPADGRTARPRHARSAPPLRLGRYPECGAAARGVGSQGRRPPRRRGLGAGGGRHRKNHVPDQKLQPAEGILAGATWRSISWRRGTKGRLSARFAALRVRIADGPAQRIGAKGNQHMPGEEAWLIGERRAGGERKFYLSHLPAGTSLRALAALIEARSICEQAHQQLKDELGLDHFEGRSWTGLHRHALMTMIAYAFLQHQRLAMGKGKDPAPDRRLNPACPPSDAPSSTTCPPHTAGRGRLLHHVGGHDRTPLNPRSAHIPGRSLSAWIRPAVRSARRDGSAARPHQVPTKAPHSPSPRRDWPLPPATAPRPSRASPRAGRRAPR
ncbi:MAG: hypothetical protein KatS3mg116_2672 [Elioraea sp.]|nr:MAG: hypothetical protein KatS3mg116_2672 [Elioraea sp.]